MDSLAHCSHWLNRFPMFRPHTTAIIFRKALNIKCSMKEEHTIMNKRNSHSQIEMDFLSPLIFDKTIWNIRHPARVTKMYVRLTRAINWRPLRNGPKISWRNLSTFNCFLGGSSRVRGWMKSARTQFTSRQVVMKSCSTNYNSSSQFRSHNREFN